MYKIFSDSMRFVQIMELKKEDLLFKKRVVFVANELKVSQKKELVKAGMILPEALSLVFNLQLINTPEIVMDEIIVFLVVTTILVYASEKRLVDILSNKKFNLFFRKVCELQD